MKLSSLLGTGIVIALAAAAVGCGSKGKGGGADQRASCNTTMGECTEYDQGNRAIGDDYLKKLCVNLEGTFATTACPKEGRTGWCHKDEGTKVYYQGYPIAVDSLEKSCTGAGGHWMKP